MADSTPAQMSGSQKWKYGHLHLIDSIPSGSVD
jgi:hypothetical protein